VSGWGWRIGKASGSGRGASAWLRAVSALVPFVTVTLLLLMFQIVGGKLATAPGVLFDLPAAGVGDEAVTESLALIVPIRHETMVFFDDSRYVIGNAASMASLEERLSERFVQSEDKTLLVLADRRVSCGELMEFAARARRSGVGRILFAEKKAREVSE